MKKRIEKRQGIGDIFDILLKIFLGLIIVYYIDTVYFYIKDRYIDTGILHYISKPLFLYIIKWVYALVMFIAISKLKKRSSLYWMLLNIVSLGILFLAVISSFSFYNSMLDDGLLEIISISLLIITNLKLFISQYSIERKASQLIYIIFIPLLITIGSYMVSEYFIENSN